MRAVLDALATWRNEAVRQALRPAVALAAGRARRDLRRRVAAFPAQQERLREQYGVRSDTPIRVWGEEVERRVLAFAAANPEARFAHTSGSTSRPKRIAFTPERLRLIRAGNRDAGVQAARALAIRRPTLFVFTALQEDGSLSSLLLDEGRARPSLLDGLVMPSRWLWSPELAPLLQAHGPTALRLWLLALSNPGLLYATNPSTLAGFFSRLHGDWAGSVALARAQVAGQDLPPGARRVLRRVAAPGWRVRLATLAAAGDRPPPLETWLPGLRAFACWDGGYVAPFLERLRRHLPAPRWAHVPMLSMSTEVVATQLLWEGEAPRFLTLAPRVLYELLPEGAPDEPARLLPAVAAEPGGVYTLVVSDPWGLLRYQTEDLFRCAGKVGQVPDLRFLRRRGLAYSFTGEKLTGEQVGAAFERLCHERPALRALGVQAALIPSLPGEDLTPGYVLALAHPADVGPGEVPAEGAGAAFDRHLAAVNPELASKQESGRLGPTRPVVLAYEALAGALDGRGETGARAWETQFKLLPLTSRRWESLGLEARRADGGGASAPEPRDPVRA